MFSLLLADPSAVRRRLPSQGEKGDIGEPGPEGGWGAMRWVAGALVHFPFLFFLLITSL